LISFIAEREICFKGSLAALLFVAFAVFGIKELIKVRARKIP
jgi:hypothetical protein